MRHVLAAIAYFGCASVHGHGGGLDSDGCHTNRKTGDYHCHRGAVATPPPSRSQQAFVPVEQVRPSTPRCHVGPRGGTYTITPSGRKNYSGC